MNIEISTLVECRLRGGFGGVQAVHAQAAHLGGCCRRVRYKSVETGSVCWSGREPDFRLEKGVMGFLALEESKLCILSPCILGGAAAEGSVGIKVLR